MVYCGIMKMFTACNPLCMHLCVYGYYMFNVKYSSTYLTVGIDQENYGFLIALKYIDPTL